MIYCGLLPSSTLHTLFLNWKSLIIYHCIPDFNRWADFSGKRLVLQTALKIFNGCVLFVQRKFYGTLVKIRSLSYTTSLLGFTQLSIIIIGSVMQVIRCWFLAIRRVFAFHLHFIKSTTTHLIRYTSKLSSLHLTAVGFICSKIIQTSINIISPNPSYYFIKIKVAYLKILNCVQLIDSKLHFPVINSRRSGNWIYLIQFHSHYHSFLAIQ